MLNQLEVFALQPTKYDAWQISIGRILIKSLEQLSRGTIMSKSADFPTKIMLIFSAPFHLYETNLFILTTTNSLRNGYLSKLILIAECL